jgi:AcrR family transcriptional regulator
VQDVSIVMKPQLIQHYITYTLEHNESPANVYLFAKHVGIQESEFYNHFSSLEAIEMQVMVEWFDTAFARCQESEPWEGYSVREKLLAVFYTFIETLKANRSFVVYLKKRDMKKFPQLPKYLSELQKRFVDVINPILQEGIGSKELAERKYLDRKYADAVWLNLLFVLNFWLEDTSAGFEKTDAAIEKSVNLAMDLMGKSALDAALDFGKFLFQNR